ncbi:MAG TPA: hypothetical protein VIP11_15715 [Gemmatimonadaceae bacterium]
MTRRDDADIRSDHHVVGDCESSKIIKRAILIYEDIAPNFDVDSTGRVEWWDQYEAGIYLRANEIAEQRPDFVRIIERQAVERGRDSHGSFDICHHGRRLRRSSRNYLGVSVICHSLFSLVRLNEHSARAVAARFAECNRTAKTPEFANSGPPMDFRLAAALACLLWALRVWRRPPADQSISRQVHVVSRVH